ncbi:hypothetical protein HXX76_004523 [Chlamydomonas incerta]|uniref:B-block binding subunit of TFIIIC domain-containing protein n=1 Tax=Chlamydomonas incerta TaxID=51695 RepID=A0A835T824_CHLIN|nr:hypothetical protein HXX76_004523 [Chlamydomonas incerta]|eukprot:KAG2439156.1 hypothetical protein HXX76_004523 [Chlamydomonas incerta]
MDALLAVAVEEIGLEGREGCRVESLWELVSARLPVGTITSLPTQLQDVLWGLLLARPADVGVYITGANPAPPPKTTATGRVKKAPPNPMLQYKKLSEHEAKSLSRSQASNDGFRLVASEAVRMSVLGVYELMDTRFPLSDLQLAALEAIGRTRGRGAINADLANRMDVAYRNFYYIVKSLEMRKLIVKNPVVFAPPGVTTTVSSVLHLPRFQPAIKLGPGQMFKTVDAIRGMEVATYVLQDDNLYMRLICSTIAETEERFVVEADLKVVCGFRGKRGHRLWRRMRKKLEDTGYLRMESSNVRGRTVPCVRLMKEWKPPTEAGGEEGPEEAGEGEGEDADEDEEGGPAGAGGGGGGRASTALAEFSLERQLLDVVCGAGPEGILNFDLFRRLGISSKAYGAKLVELIKRHNLEVAVVNRGRVVLNRITAPPPLLRAAGHVRLHDTTLTQLLRYSATGERPTLQLGGPEAGGPRRQGLLPAPPSGAGAVAAAAAKAAVQAAIAAAGATSPGAGPSTAGPGGAAAAAEAEEGASDQDQEPGGGADGGNEDEDGAGGAAAPKEKPAKRRRTGGSAAAAAPAGAAGAIVPVDAAAGGKEKKPHWTKVITLKTEDRLKLLLDYLNNHRFIVRVQVRRLVMEWETAASGRPLPKANAGPDVKTVRRLMERLVSSGRAKMIMVPTAGFLGDARPIETILRPDLEESPALLDEIRRFMAEFERKLRSECCRNALAAKRLRQSGGERVAPLLAPEQVLPPSLLSVVQAAAAEAEAAAAAGPDGDPGALPAPDTGAYGPADANDGEPEDALLRRVADSGVGWAASANPDAEAAAQAQGEVAALPGAAGAAAAARRTPGLGGAAGGAGASSRGGLGLSALRNIDTVGLGRNVMRIGAFEHSQRATANGLIPAKMVRVRLLHFLITKLVGLGGFEGDPAAAAEPEPEVLANMPRGLGSDMYANSAEHGGGRQAFAFGGMGAGAAAANLGPQALTGAVRADRRCVSVRRLWAVMPLSVALQVLGSSCSRPPEELAKLCEGGATLGSLPREVALDVMDSTSVNRLEYLISILRRLRLLEWVVADPAASRRPGNPMGGMYTGKNTGILLNVLGKGVLEIPFDQQYEAPPADSGVDIVTTKISGLGTGNYVEVSLSNAAGLDEYWRRFEEYYKLERAGPSEMAKIKRCFPATTVPEVLSKNVWYGQRLMTAVQWLRLQAGLERIDLSDGSQITGLAAELGLDVDVVARIVYDRRRRQPREGEELVATVAEGGEGGGGAGGGGGRTVLTVTRRVPIRLPRLYVGVRGVTIQGKPAAAADGEVTSLGVQRKRRRSLRTMSPASRERYLMEKAADLEAKAARKAARAAVRAEKEAARAARRNLPPGRRQRRKRAAPGDEGQEEGAAGPEGEQGAAALQRRRLGERKRRKAGERDAEDEGEEGDGEPRRRRKKSKHHAAKEDAAGGAAAAAANWLLLPTPFVDRHARAAPPRAPRGSDSGSDSGDGAGRRAAGSDSEQDDEEGDDGAVPSVRMPSSAAPSRHQRVRWTMSEDRVLMAWFVRHAAERWPRVAWKEGEGVLPYDQLICTRHVRYLKRVYHTHMGRIMDLVKRAFHGRLAMDRVRERRAARQGEYRERLRRRKLGLAPQPPGAPASSTPVAGGGGGGHDGAAPLGRMHPVPDLLALAAATPAPEELAAAAAARAAAKAALAAREAVGADACAAAASRKQRALDVTRAIVGGGANAAAGEGEEAAAELPHTQEPAPAEQAAAAAAEPPTPPPPPAVVLVDPLEAAEQALQHAEEESELQELHCHREALIGEALVLAESLVASIQRRKSQQIREEMQQRGTLSLGARLTTVALAAAMRQAAKRSSLGEVAATAAAATAAEKAAAAVASSAGAVTGRKPVTAPLMALMFSSAAAALPKVATVPRPGMAIAAAMSQLLGLLYHVHAAAAASGAATATAAAWRTPAVVAALADFTRRFPAETKTAALKQLQSRGWLLPPAPKRQLDLTPAYLMRLYGNEMPAGLFGRAATAAARLDRLLAQLRRTQQGPQRAAAAAAANAAEHMEVDGDGEDEAAAADGAAEAQAAQAEELALGAAVGDPERQGAVAVQRGCAVDAARGAVVVECGDSMSSELVAVVLARQAAGWLELLPGPVDSQSEWAGQGTNTGALVTSVKLLITPGPAAAAAATAAAARGDGKAGDSKAAAGEKDEPAATGPVGAAGAAAPAAAAAAPVPIAAPPAIVGTPVVVTPPPAATLDSVPQERSAAGRHQPHHHLLHHHLHHHAHPHRRRDSGSGHAAADDAPAQPPAQSQAQHGWPWPGAYDLPPERPPLFSPAEVATSAAVRAAATAACRAALATEAAAASCPPSILAELMEATAALLGAAGADGLTLAELTTRLEAAASGAGAKPGGGGEGGEGQAGAAGGRGGGGGKVSVALSAPATHHHIALVLRGLEGHGLLRRLGGWEAVHFVAAQHSNSLVTWPAPPPSQAQAQAGEQPQPQPAADGAPAAGAPAEAQAGAVQPPAGEGASTAAEPAASDAAPTTSAAAPAPEDAAPAAAAAAAAGADSMDTAEPDAAPAPQAPQAPLPPERPLRPWVDHTGAVNAKLWAALVTRVLALVMRHPGVPEELLVSHLDTLPPQAARELLHHMAAHGRVAVRTLVVPGAGAGVGGAKAGGGGGAGAPPRRPLLLGGGRASGGAGGGGAVAGAGAGAGAAAAAAVRSGHTHVAVHYFPVIEQYGGERMLLLPPP